MSEFPSFPFRTSLRTLSPEERGARSKSLEAEGAGGLPSLEERLAQVEASERPSIEEWQQWLQDPDERALLRLFERHGVRVQNLPAVMEWIAHRVLGREEELWHPLLDWAMRARWLRSRWAVEAVEARLQALEGWLGQTREEEAPLALLAFQSPSVARLVAQAAPEVPDALLEELLKSPEATPPLAERADLRDGQRVRLAEWAMERVAYQNPPVQEPLGALGYGSEVVTRRQRDAAVQVIRSLAERGTHVSEEGMWRLVEALKQRRKVPLAEETVRALLSRPTLAAEDFERMYAELSHRPHLLQHLVRHPEAPLSLLARIAREDRQGQTQNAIAKLPRALGDPEVRLALCESGHTPNLLRALLQDCSAEEMGRLLPRLIELSPQTALDVLEKGAYPAHLQPQPALLAPLLLVPEAKLRLRAMITLTRPSPGSEESREGPERAGSPLSRT